MKIIEGLVQGSPQWKALRAKYPCASEAPVIMGASRHMTRGEMLRLKAAGMEKEFSDYVQRMVLDKGHEVEAPARDLTEVQLGEPLFPATAVSDDEWGLASLDGITMTEETIFEHKQWNEELAAAIRAGATEFPGGLEWQLEHQLIVAESAEKVVFVCSDGTAARRVQMEYRRVPGRAGQLRAGWAQFHADLAAGVAPPAPLKAVAEPLELLPAVNLRMEGALQVVSNLDKLEPLLRAFVDRIPAKPSTDEEFATTDAACKALKRLEDELDRSEAAALGSLEPVEQMQRLKAMLHKLARDTRLHREKLVEARKIEIRTEEVTRGKQALSAFIDGLNRTIGKPYMPQVANDFPGAIRGKKTVQSLRDAVDQHLADCKLSATESCTRIQANLAALRELASEHVFLFADTGTLVQKAPDDCRAVITSRIAEHRAAEEEARAAEKARQEQAAREAAQRQKNEMALQEIQGIQQQVMIATLGRAGVRKGGTIECIRETLAETEGWRIEEANFGALTGAAQAAKDSAVAEIRLLLADAEARAEQQCQQQPAPTANVTEQLADLQMLGTLRSTGGPGSGRFDFEPAAGPAVIPMPTRPAAPQALPAAWHPADTLPKEPPDWIEVQTVCTYRFQPYKPASQEARRGIRGRWQCANGFGGWENCEQPSGPWRPAPGSDADGAAIAQHVVAVSA